MEEGLNAVYCCPKFGPAFGQNDFTLLDGDP